jgi:hypothetical protein
MTQIDTFKPIKLFGYCFILMGLICIFMHFLLLQDKNYTIEFEYFVLIIAFFHLLVGVGIIFKKKWGFSVFKFYLYFLYLAIPVGTYISIKTFKYIEKHQIDNFFK